MATKDELIDGIIQTHTIFSPQFVAAGIIPAAFYRWFHNVRTMGEHHKANKFMHVKMLVALQEFRQASLSYPKEDWEHLIGLDSTLHAVTLYKTARTGVLTVWRTRPNFTRKGTS